MAKKKEEETNESKDDRINRLRALINKSAGKEISYNLTKHNPTKVKRWVSTGSRWLDSIMVKKGECGGQPAGIPEGRIVEIAGENATGKSYMAAQIALRGQSMGFDVVWFDGEFQLSPDFLIEMGMDVDRLIYVEAESIESMLVLTETLLLQDTTPKIFVVDSIAAIPTQNAIAGGFSPTETVAEKARILSLGFSKLTVPLGRHGSIFLALNQLKMKIGRGPQDRIDLMIEPMTTPGGKALSYHSSLRIWLTKRQGKAHFILDEDGEKIGATLKALVKKSRFGSEGRSAEFQIYWKGGKVRIADEESWLDSLKNCRTDEITFGAWSILKFEDGTEVKFRQGDWLEHLKDEKFHNRVLELLNKHLIKE